MDNFEVRHKEAEEALRNIGRRIKEEMPKGYGFTLLIYSYGENGNMFYLSSAERGDMIKAMQEFIAKQGLSSEKK